MMGRKGLDFDESATIQRFACWILLAVRSVASACVFCILACLISAQPQTRRMITSNDPPDVNPQYFPIGVFSEYPDLSDFRSRWYAKHLRAMSEPSMLEAAKDKSVEGYRFLWLRTFRQPIAIRMTIRPDGSAQLTGIEMTGKGGYDPGIVATTQIVEISQDQIHQFRSLLDTTEYWSMPTVDVRLHEERIRDGDEWILEGVRDGRYHVVARVSPRNGTYREACLYLLSLSKIEVDANRVH